MKNYVFLLIVFCLGLNTSKAKTFEDIYSAVNNMGLGWNLGNRLDANSGGINDMWIEAWTERKPSNYETAWGQSITTQEMIHLFKEAGFQAIRVPVTWWPHMGTVIVEPEKTDWKAIWDPSTWTGYEIDTMWMARVKEVVDYIIDEGMYCILNVHHDTGAPSSDKGLSTAWLYADEDTYKAQKERFEALWTNIANEFKEYDEHLLFEGYNEMLDRYGSWCFASFATPNNYDASVAEEAYSSINKYAQSFVDAVRATGGNNLERNLIVNTYAACSGEGFWNSHLIDPLKEFVLPKDEVDNHIAIEVHAYPYVSNQSEISIVVDDLINKWQTYLIPKGAPVILGEWNSQSAPTDQLKLALAKYIVENCKNAAIPAFHWMGLIEGKDAETPQWTESDIELRDTLIEAYYGPDGYQPAGIVSLMKEEYRNEMPIYNIQGILVKDMSTPGIYIQCGKKYIIY